jgi:hypothetical protein
MPLRTTVLRQTRFRPPGPRTRGRRGERDKNREPSEGDTMREEYYERDEIIERGGFFGGEEIIERETIVERDGFFGGEEIIERETVVERGGFLGGLLGGEEIIEREVIVEDNFF